jgi:hypothetical protein
MNKFYFYVKFISAGVVSSQSNNMADVLTVVGLELSSPTTLIFKNLECKAVLYSNFHNVLQTLMMPPQKITPNTASCSMTH